MSLLQEQCEALTAVPPFQPLLSNLSMDIVDKLVEKGGKVEASRRMEERQSSGQFYRSLPLVVLPSNAGSSSGWYCPVTLALPLVVLPSNAGPQTGRVVMLNECQVSCWLCCCVRAYGLFFFPLLENSGARYAISDENLVKTFIKG